jgi:iron complex transport system substrate-binding protein
LYEIDVDAMAALKVDFIITQSQCEVCAVNFDDVMQAVHTREELKGARVVSLNPNSLDSIFADIARVAEVTSKAEIHAAADRVINALKDRLKRLSEITRLHGRRRVACLEWIDPVMLAANWIPEIIDAAGGECHLVAPGTPSQYASWSDIVAFDPEFIILMPCGFDLDRAAAEARALADDAGFPGFFDLSAVRNDRVFAVDANAYFTRPGPRVVDSAEIVGHLLHPESVALPPGANLFRRLNVADKSDRQIGMGQ